MGEALGTEILGVELRANRRSAAIGLFVMASVLVFIVITIRPLAQPAWPIDLWVAAMATLLLVVGAMIVRSLREGDSNAGLAPYVRISRYCQTLMSLLITISVWIMLPPAGPELQALMLMLYVWYIATVVAASTAAAPVPARDIVLLTASIIGWVLWDRPAYWPAWAVFIAMAGITMLGFRRLIRQSVVAAVEARIASQVAEAITSAALTAAENARDAKTRFIAAASHDLQQPIHAASLFFEAAIDMPDGVPRRRAIEGARAAFGSTQGLIGSMLDHLRLEAGAVPARITAVPVAEAMAGVAAEQLAAAQAAGITIRCRPTRLAVAADPQLLRRAIGNLVANAVRHSRGSRLLLTARLRGETAEIWAIDNGAGIADADQAGLFDDFTQGSGDTPGFGIGLASVRRQMELMGGSAAHARRWRRGAAFVLRLPAAMAISPQAIAAE